MERDDPREPREPEIDDSQLDDPEFEASLKALPSVQVPAGFLPNVMYQVYEVHHREKVRLPAVAGLVLGLLSLSLGFFLWEVRRFAQDRGIDSFGSAFWQKIESVTTDTESIIDLIVGMIVASWHLISGAAGIFLSPTALILIVLVLAGIIALIYFVRRR